MRQELQTKLYEDYPQLLQTTLAIGDGWYEILRKTCQDIMATSPQSDYRFVQIKEKFGGLRIYTDPYVEDLQGFIKEAESKSFKTCEKCGDTETAMIRGKGWIQTLCEKCDE